MRAAPSPRRSPSPSASSSRPTPSDVDNDARWRRTDADADGVAARCGVAGRGDDDDDRPPNRRGATTRIAFKRHGRAGRTATVAIVEAVVLTAPADPYLSLTA